MPRARRKDIPGEEADPDDRTGKRIPDDISETVEPPAESQDVSEKEMRKLQKAGRPRDRGKG
jgi:hypothetical protein